jgi:hypothetical protein
MNSGDGLPIDLYQSDLEKITDQGRGFIRKRSPECGGGHISKLSPECAVS